MFPSEYHNKNQVSDFKLQEILNDNYEIESLLHDLFTYVNTRSQSILIGNLSRYPKKKIIFYLPQLVNTSLLFHNVYPYNSVLSAKAAVDQNFALLMYWNLCSYSESFLKDAVDRFKVELEDHIINGTSEIQRDGVDIYSIPSISEKDHLTRFIREIYFKHQLKFIDQIIDVTRELNEKTEYFDVYLRSFLEHITISPDFGNYNSELVAKLKRGVVIPFNSNYDEQIVNIVPSESIVFKTNTKAPYLLVVETIDLAEPDPNPRNSTSIKIQNNNLASGLFENLIDTWEGKSMRVQLTSKYSKFDSWKLRGIIVKAGDDLKKEQLAMQIIKKCQELFQRERLQIFLRPFDIIPTKDDSGIIEYVPNTISISGLKEILPEYNNLKSIIEIIWQRNLDDALKNFTESVAGYSIVSYILNLKDRHNKNILIDRDCHIIHIDFGFFFTKSPGFINFEKAPFKLTSEMIEVMGGYSGDMFSYFKSLMISGILVLRKYYSEFYPLIQMMIPGKQIEVYGESEEKVLADFSSRLFVNLEINQVEKMIENIIDDAADNWRTNKYDLFQKLTNKIF